MPAILGFIGRRCLATLPVLAGAVVFTFVVMRLLPADPAAFLASGPGMGQAEIEAIRVSMGLDRSIPEQLAIYAGDVLRGDLGRSYTKRGDGAPREYAWRVIFGKRQGLFHRSTT